jgi:MFS family permease
MFPRAVWILFAGTLVNRFGNFVLVFLILYLTRQGYSAGQAGVAVATYGVGGIVASIVGGHLADLMGRRKAIAVSMFSAAVVVLVLGRVESLPAIVALTGLLGLTAELYRPASSAMLMDLTRPDERVTAFAAYRLAINLGTAAGPVVGGLLAERSFALLFYGDAVTCVVFGVVALVALPAGVRTSHEQERSAPWTAMFRDRPFMVFLLASTLAGTVYAQMHSGFALQVVTLGFSDATYGLLAGLNGLVVLALELPIAGITRRRARTPVIALGFLLVGIGFGLTGLAGTVPLLALTVVVWTLGEIISAPVMSAHASDLAPDHMRGRYHGALSLTFGIGLVAGPALGARLFAWNPGVLWGACAVLGALAALLVLGSGAPRPASRDEPVTS